MQTMGSNNSDLLGDQGSPALVNQTTVAASFADREQARTAAKRLREEGFHDTWMGVTQTDDSVDYSAQAATETRVAADNWFTRVFGEGDESLHDALVRHGVSESDAQAAGTLPGNRAILTVDGSNHAEFAVQIISECGGTLITRGFGSTGYGTADAYAATTSGTSMTAKPAAYDVAADDVAAAGIATAAPDQYGTELPLAGTRDYNDYGKYRGGDAVDESTRLQLREERLRIDKTAVSSGSASIGTKVVSTTQDIDVPLMHEELFIERRPASGTAVSDTTPIGAGSVIEVPLTEEKLTVSKSAFVTEEVVVGKRQVQDVQHVSETTLKEELNVVDQTVTTDAGLLGTEKRY